MNRLCLVVVLLMFVHIALGQNMTYDCSTSQYTINMGNFQNLALFTRFGNTDYQIISFAKPPGGNLLSIYFTVRTGETYLLGNPFPNYSTPLFIDSSQTTCPKYLSVPDQEATRVLNLARNIDYTLPIIYRNTMLDNACLTALDGSVDITTAINGTGYQIVAISFGLKYLPLQGAPVNPGAVIQTLKNTVGYLDTRNRELGVYYNGNGSVPVWYFIFSSREILCPNPTVGLVDGTDQCDDGNSVAGDGCTNCTVDNTYTCSQTMFQEQSVCSLIVSGNGACCNPGGVCTQSTAAGCPPPGVYQGVGTGCRVGLCNSGACCTLGGSCTIVPNVGACTGGIFRGPQTICTGHTCVTGACCTGTSCGLVTGGFAQCTGGAQYQGDLTTCIAGSCANEVTGGCCFGGNCSIITGGSNECTGTYAGSYLGDSSTCTTACPVASSTTGNGGSTTGSGGSTTAGGSTTGGGNSGNSGTTAGTTAGSNASTLQGFLFHFILSVINIFIF